MKCTHLMHVLIGTDSTDKTKKKTEHIGTHITTMNAEEQICLAHHMDQVLQFNRNSHKKCNALQNKGTKAQRREKTRVRHVSENLNTFKFIKYSVFRKG